jgi:Arylsulfotransferase (ASST)
MNSGEARLMIRWVAGGLGGVALLAVGALLAAGSFGGSGAASASAPGVPDLRPPRITVLRHSAGLGPGLIVLGAKNRSPSPGEQSGPLLVDDLGRPVWFRPLPPGQVASDVRVQRYQGRPVLTWWQGSTLGGAGHGQGEGVIADSSYHVIAHVKAGHGYFADQHTFLLTPQDTALIECYHETRADLSSAGGSRDGRVYDGIVQEIDLATGRVLFEWHSLAHVPVSDSYEPAPRDPNTPYDYFHINSVGLAPDGNLLISSRHTWTVYEVDRHTGRIVWRLGGKQSDFKLGRGARFAWQHNPMPVGRDELRIFDNESNGRPVEPASRVITLRLDFRRKTATLVRSIEHPARLSAPSQGNSELLPGGDLFVGWGRLGRFSEFGPDGRLLLDAVFPPGYDTYRAYRFPWAGDPSTEPAAAAHRDGAGTAVEAFWNGATNVARWSILAGSAPTSLQGVASVPWNGLDTRMRIPTRAAWVEVAAQDAAGDTVGTSAPVRVVG